jgi:cation:H+ antiporter
MLVENIIFFVSALGILILSGGWIVKLLVRLAKYLGLSDFAVAFILMAFATSIPELFVGINSALAGNPALSFGNVIGSNIADLTIVVGIAALIGRGISIKTRYVKRDVIYMILFSLLPLFLLLSGNGLSRVDGAILLGAFGIYLFDLIKKRRRMDIVKEKRYEKLGLLLLLFLGSLAMLFASSHLVVQYGVALAKDLLVPSLFIGLFMIAIGTSLPELVFEIRAVLAGKEDLAFGDVMGSVVANSSLVLGVTSMIRPIVDSFSIFLISAIYMVAVVFVFSGFVLKNNRIGIIAGLVLVFLYILFVILGISVL